ncbi:MAG: 50S ribosomal protein L10 [bacterium]
MPSLKNTNEVKVLEEKLTSSSAIFLADYTNLTVKEQVELRDLIKKAGGELKVTKNRLLKIALQNQIFPDKKIPAEFEEYLRGPNLTLFAGSDAVAPLKALVEFAKKNALGKPEVRTGVLDKNVLSITSIKQLAALPGKDQLIAKLIYTIQAPLSGLASLLSAPMRNLTYALSAIKDKPASPAESK